MQALMVSEALYSTSFLSGDHMQFLQTASQTPAQASAYISHRRGRISNHLGLSSLRPSCGPASA